MKRRHFLNLVAGATLSSITPPIVAAPAPRWDRILVLVELNGGNDGLNTVVPYSNRTYYRLRPTLAVPRDNVLALSEQAGQPGRSGISPLFKGLATPIPTGPIFAPSRSGIPARPLRNI